MSENRFLKWLSASTDSIYWHDSAIRREQLAAFENGAVGMTTNPFLINSTLQADAGFWKETLEGFPKELAGDEKTEELIRRVTTFYADAVKPVYARGEFGKGYVCAQTNPNRTGDAAYMLEQAKRIASWAANIVIKLPATAAGLEVYEECAALGYNVAATISFTVPQVLKVAQAHRRGKKRAAQNAIKPGLAIAVLMVGRLDDYIRDVAQDSGSAVRESDVIQAGTACIKRAYEIFAQEGYDTALMPAGCRSASHITELAGARMIMSIAPKIADMLADVDVFEERINAPVAQDVINRLLTLDEFRKAYDPDGMKPKEFITFGSTNRTTAQFIECGWNPLRT